MDTELGDTGVSLGEVADTGKAVSSLGKSLPGMVKGATEGINLNEPAQPFFCAIYHGFVLIVKSFIL